MPEFKLLGEPKVVERRPNGRNAWNVNPLPNKLGRRQSVDLGEEGDSEGPIYLPRRRLIENISNGRMKNSCFPPLP